MVGNSGGHTVENTVCIRFARTTYFLICRLTLRTLPTSALLRYAVDNVVLWKLSNRLRIYNCIRFSCEYIKKLYCNSFFASAPKMNNEPRPTLSTVKLGALIHLYILCRQTLSALDSRRAAQSIAVDTTDARSAGVVFKGRITPLVQSLLFHFKNSNIT